MLFSAGSRLAAQLELQKIIKDLPQKVSWVSRHISSACTRRWILHEMIQDDTNVENNPEIHVTQEYEFLNGKFMTDNS
jgi:hypothetical protein